MTTLPESIAWMELPIAHDRVIAWDMVCPDIVQRVLLVVIAADGQIVDPALPEMGRALFTNQGGTTTSDGCPVRPSIVALLGAS